MAECNSWIFFGQRAAARRRAPPGDGAGAGSRPPPGGGRGPRGRPYPDARPPPWVETPGTGTPIIGHQLAWLAAEGVT
ncbi:hypothetical protein ACFWMG_44150, partial [Streptomyces sp. NPDC127074]